MPRTGLSLLLLAATVGFGARGNFLEDCWLVLLQGYGHFYPVSVGPTAVFEALKRDVARELLLHRGTSSGLLARALHLKVSDRLATAEMPRKLKILAQLIGSVRVEWRTGIVGGIDDGPRGLPLKEWLGRSDGTFPFFVRRYALEGLVALNHPSAWREVALAASASSDPAWHQELRWAAAQHGARAEKSEPFQQGLAELQKIERVVEGDALALAVTRGRGSIEAAAARRQATQVQDAIRFVRDELLAP